MGDIDDVLSKGILNFPGYSVNYPVDEANFDIQDPESVLKSYLDKNTDSGNQVEVPPIDPCPIVAHVLTLHSSVKRKFCGKCGR